MTSPKKIDEKVKENSRIPKRITGKLSLYSYAERTTVNLKNAIEQTLNELGFPPQPDFLLSSLSEVSPQHLRTLSFFYDEHANVTKEYHIVQNNKNNTTKTKKEGLASIIKRQL